MDSDPNSTGNNQFKYEFSSIEMIQEQHQTNQIYIDYNLGLSTNLVDRDVYKLSGDTDAADLKAKMSEKLKFVLSDKDAFDPYEGQKKVKMSKKILIPAKFLAHDKIHTYGGKIEDPFRTNILNPHEMEARVFTHESHQNQAHKRLDGIKQIDSTFEKAKQVIVGSQKPGTEKRVLAKRVY